MDDAETAFLAATKGHRRDLVKIGHAHLEAHILPACKRALEMMIAMANDPPHAATCSGILALMTTGRLLAIQDSHLKLIGTPRDKREAALRILLEAALKLAIVQSDKVTDEHGREFRPDGTTYEEPRR